MVQPYVLDLPLIYCDSDSGLGGPRLFGNSNFGLTVTRFGGDVQKGVVWVTLRPVFTHASTVPATKTLSGSALHM